MTVNQSEIRPETPGFIEHKHWWNLFGKMLGHLRQMNVRAAAKEDINLIVDEYLPAQYNVVSIQVPPQVQNPVIIETVIAYASASSAVLQVGDRIIPIPMGQLVNLQGLNLLRNIASPSTLTATVPGTLFLEVMGRQIPRIAE